MKELLLVRSKSNQISTVGVLYKMLDVGTVFDCFTLEDGHKETKVKGKTRIPAGRYPIIMRMYGEHFEKYSKRFGEEHPIIEIGNVPNFTDILIHIGNYIEDTEGCILPGTRFGWDGKRAYYVSNSTEAYLRLHKWVLENKPTHITIVDNDLNMKFRNTI